MITLLETNEKILLILLIAFVLDLITGVSKAIENKTFSSSKFRQTASKLINYIVVAIIGVITDYGFNLNFMLKTVTIYLIAVEVSSIIENLDAMGVKLPKSLTMFFESKIEESEKTITNNESTTENKEKE